MRITVVVTKKKKKGKQKKTKRQQYLLRHITVVAITKKKKRRFNSFLPFHTLNLLQQYTVTMAIEEVYKDGTRCKKIH